MDHIECPTCKGKINLDQIDPGVVPFDRQMFLYRFDKTLNSLYGIEIYTLTLVKLLAKVFKVPLSEILPELFPPREPSGSPSENLSNISSAPEQFQDDSLSRGSADP